MQETRPTIRRLSTVEVDKLLAFYTVKSLEELIYEQAEHIEHLQKKLATKDSFTRTCGVRIG